MAVLFTAPFVTALNLSGLPISGATLTFYATGTSTLATVYADSALATPLLNPVVADVAGRFVPIYLGNGTFRAILKDASGATIRDVDPANATAASDTAVSVKNYGTGTDPGALINAAIAAGATNILIPQATNWVWLTTATLPDGWRGSIRAVSDKTSATSIKARTGINYPCIDMQGTSFCTIDGLNVFADGNAGTACASFLVMARMPTGASSSNHRIVNNIALGVFEYACVYNIGSEELVLRDNYWALYGNTSAANMRRAPIVHALSEDAFFSPIITKASRTNGTSCSAIIHNGDDIKNQNTSGSGIYLAPNVNDITIDLVYGTASAGSTAFITASGAYDGIRVGISRVELTKSIPLFAAPNDFAAGTFSLYRGAYRRSGAVDATKYLIDIGGTTASTASIHIAPGVSFTDNSGGGTEDIYLVRSTRRTTANIDLTCIGQPLSAVSGKVNITQLTTSTIVMGFRSNLTVGSYLFNNSLTFYYDGGTLQAREFQGGVNVTSGSVSVPLAGKTAAYTMTLADGNLTFAGAATTAVQLLDPTTCAGRIVIVRTTTAFALNSAFSTVVPLGGGAAGTAILVATAGKFAMLQSDGTAWQTMMAN